MPSQKQNIWELIPLLLACQGLASKFSLLILASDIISPLPLLRCHTDGQNCSNKGLFGWKGKVNKTAWWKGCRWLLEVFQQNEQQFILEQPREYWLNWDVMIVLLNPFESFLLFPFNVSAILKKCCFEWKVRSFIIRKWPYETFWLFHMEHIDFF